MSLRHLAMLHAGRPGVVIGGGPSAPWCFVPALGGNAPRDAVVCSTNDHGFRCELFPPVDYMVACDHIEPRLRKWKAPIIGLKKWADYRVFETRTNQSGPLAAYALWTMGCAPIVLTGCDCYSDGTYFWDLRAKSGGNNARIDRHVQRWRVLDEMAPGHMVRAMSGPLLDVFPRYDPGEPVTPVGLTQEEMERHIGGVRVKFTRDFIWLGVGYEEGAVVDLRPGDAANLLLTGAACELYR